ncbi:efflux RND transporter permease subunit [Natronocalculus amylovorans]|uniref:MMPL family transporter n=1 Tax=Natronocalculus amylovorans TaxID=2917812 RepID=A0AAE3G0F6_9EURY|nr:MMPL family transporter [Natronocalculus amylovorans]MCL9818195.1 MMPL family transporter [Natronocalculus amylovorans]
MTASGPTDDTSETKRSDPVTPIINRYITTVPWRVVGVFLLLTVFFVVGIGGTGEQQAGADQFTADLEEADALEEMEERFSQNQRASGGSSATLFISDDRNVLSKPVLLRILDAQDQLETRDRLRVSSTGSPASNIALQLDPTADTAEQQYQSIERASDRQIERAIQDADESGALGPVSQDFSAPAASASVMQVFVNYDVPASADTGDAASLQFETVDIVDAIDGFTAGDNVVVFADAILEDEILQLLTDTAIVVFPAAILLIMFFLIVAYRDPLDLLLGVTALVMTLVWTFGFMGYANIPFSDSMVTVFPLLLAVGIDFGIHIINRYREERAEGAAITEAMRLTSTQLTAAFLIVTITTVFSFIANLTSSLDSTREFGIVAAAGMVFTFLIFGVFLPAGKVGLDNFREGRRIPTFGVAPLGNEDSILGRVLPVGVWLARVAPVVVLSFALLIGAAGGFLGAGVDTEFSEEAFFPDQERIDQYQSLPGPLAPSDYTFMQVLDRLENDFGVAFVGSVTVFIDDPQVRSDIALREIDRAIQNPPPSIEATDRRAESDSILDVIDSRAAEDPEFDQFVRASDSTGDGVPDKNIDLIYQELFDSPRSGDAASYVTSDRSAARIIYDVDVDAEQAAITADAQGIADAMRLDAVATGDLVVNQVVIDQITDSAIRSLFVAFILTGVFLILSYRWLEGRAVYGAINLVPIVVTVGALAGTMRVLDIALTPINAPILAVSIGLGVDYTVHFMHRFVDEFENRGDVDAALMITARGTGGALTGSMFTTVTGLGTLFLAFIPLIQDFGLLLALGVLYAYLASILILPATIVVWHRFDQQYELPSGVEKSLPWRQ